MERRNLKVLLLKEILSNKHTLFGSFSPTLSKTDKNNAWKCIHQKAQALGLVPEAKEYSYTRDVLWQNIKKASVKKRDNSRQTGTGGGPSSKINQVDEFVFQIIGRDTPALDGLVELESVPSTSQSALTTVENTPDTVVETTAPPTPPIPAHKPSSDKKKLMKLKEEKLKLINKYLLLKIKKLQSETNLNHEEDVVEPQITMLEEYLNSDSDSVE